MTGTPSGPPGGGTLSVILSLLAADTPQQIMNAPQDWPRWAALLPHVLAAAGHFDNLPHNAQQPGADDASWLLDRAATYLQVHAQFSEARPLAERALAIAEAAHGPAHRTTAVHLNDLALLLYEMGRSAEARPLAERALAIGEAS
jgi:tetratricopeptide (TPR) repeat protein